MFKKLIALTCLTFSISAHAATYTYTGNTYEKFTSWRGQANPVGGSNIYDDSMYLTLSFNTDSLLLNFDLEEQNIALVNSFVANDGVTTFTESTADLREFRIKTDSAGNILEWEINLRYWDEEEATVGEITENIMSTAGPGPDDPGDFVWTKICLEDVIGFCTLEYNEIAENSYPQGTWTVTPSTVPIPAAAWLFGSALLGLGVVKRKKNQSKEVS